MISQKELIATREIDAAAEREKISRNVFAQHAIKANEIEEDLRLADEAIGNPEDVEAFVTKSLTNLLGVQITATTKGFILYTTNLPPVLKTIFPEINQIKVSFYSPVPEGYNYIGRNHPFVEQLCQYLLANSFDHNLRFGPARASVIKTKDVSVKTTILLFRVRNVIEDKSGLQQIVTEEMLTWGYRGTVSDMDVLSKEDIENLMSRTIPSADISNESRIDFLENELEQTKNIRQEFDQIAKKRAEILIEAHERFRIAIGGSKYKVVEPVLPMDLMGMYILLP